MLSVFTRSLASIMCAFAYRIRGGGWFDLGSDVPCRIIWGMSLALAFFVTHIDSPNWTFIALLPFLAYASMYIPHAYCQNMGRWATPQKKFPSFWLPTLEDSEWYALPWAWRAAYDFAGMASVAALRAAIIFSPFVGLLSFQGYALDLSGVGRAAAVLIAGQPLSYFFGWFIPFTFPSLAAKSIEWGEFLNGIVYGVAMGQL